MNKFQKLICGALLLLTCIAPARAQDGAKEEADKPSLEIDKSLFYETPSIKTMSQLFWAIQHNDINSNLLVDNFLLINECDIYSDHFHNEFEWKEIRAAGRDYIEQNKKSFPTRFSFMQPFKLGEYDIAKSRFEVLDDFKINAARRFRMSIPDCTQGTCGRERAIPGYPCTVVLELSRPFNLTYVPVAPDVAETFIETKSKEFATYHEKYQNKSVLYDMRDAYLVMNVKIYASQGEIKEGGGSSATMAVILAVLESYEVYADEQKTTLLFARQFRKSKKAPAAANEGPESEE